MAVSDLHTARIELMVRKAIEEFHHEHLCVCERCFDPTEAVDEDELDPCIRVADINVRQIAQQIMVGLKKLGC